MNNASSLTNTTTWTALTALTSNISTVAFDATNAAILLSNRITNLNASTTSALSQQTRLIANISLSPTTPTALNVSSSLYYTPLTQAVRGWLLSSNPNANVRTIATPPLLSNNPTSILLTASGSFLISDYDGSKVIEISPSLNFSSQTRTTFVGSRPLGLARIGNNDILIALFHPTSPSVMRVNASGSPVWESASAPFNYPWAIAVLSDLRVMVTDYLAQRIVVLNGTTGVTLGSLQMQWPNGTNVPPSNYTGIVADSADRLYVADDINGRVFMIWPNGTIIRTLGQPGLNIGQFQTLRGLMVDDMGNVAACDPTSNRITIFSPTGTLYGFMNLPGSPRWVAPGPFGTLAVSEISPSAVRLY